MAFKEREWSRQGMVGILKLAHTNTCGLSGAFKMAHLGIWGRPAIAVYLRTVGGEINCPSVAAFTSDSNMV